jgi:hypothetical protein
MAEVGTQIYLGNKEINSTGLYFSDKLVAINTFTAPLTRTDGLVFYVDAGDLSSYAGSGTLVNGLNYVTGTPKTGSLSGGYTSLYGGTFVLSSSLENGIVFSDSGMPSGSQSRTLGAWVYNDTANGNPLWYGTAATNQGIGMQQISSGNTFRFYGYANDFDTSVTNMWNRWVYMVGTFDGTNAKIYLDGTLIATSNRSGWNTVLSGFLTLGKTIFGGSSGNWVNGYLSVAEIYNRVLSDAEVLENYNRFSSRFS